MKTLGEQFFQLRKERQLTQEDIASALNVTRQTVSNWETDRVKPTLDKAIELANLYNISLDALVGQATLTEKKPSPLLQKYIGAQGTLYVTLTPDQPFYPSCEVKQVEILACNDISMEVMVHAKNKARHMIYLKDVLAFQKEVH